MLLIKCTHNLLYTTHLYPQNNNLLLYNAIIVLLCFYCRKGNYHRTYTVILSYIQYRVPFTSLHTVFCKYRTSPISIDQRPFSVHSKKMWSEQLGRMKAHKRSHIRKKKCVFIWLISRGRRRKAVWHLISQPASFLNMWHLILRLAKYLNYLCGL